jgi:hypothetical protein
MKTFNPLDIDYKFKKKSTRINFFSRILNNWDFFVNFGY